MRKVIFSLLVVILTLGLVLGCAGTAPSPTPSPSPSPSPSPTTAPEPVKFKAVSFAPVTAHDVDGFRDFFIPTINEEFGDYIEVELIGGPEVTSPFQLHEAVLNGTLDMCLTSCAYYPALLYEAQTIMFTNKTPAEIQTSGAQEMLAQLHEDVGLIWLGGATPNERFHLYTNFNPTTTSTFKGKNIRVFPAFFPLTDALDAVPINLPMGDIYTAMERGTVDGFVQTHTGFVSDYSWDEVTRYAVDQEVYDATAVILVNMDKWNKLPTDIQNQIRDYKYTVIDPAMADYYQVLMDDTWQVLIDAGVEPVKMSDNDKFLELAYGSAWDMIIENSPDLGPELKGMLIK